MFASFESNLLLVFTYSTFHPKYDFFGCLGFLVKHRLGLTTVTRLLAVITTFALCEERGLAGLVLRHLVWGVLPALLPLAVSPTCLGNVDHDES